MKTLTIPFFQSNPHLKTILQRLVVEFPIDAIFYNADLSSNEMPQLLICSATPQDATTIKERRWVRNAYAKTNVLINVKGRLSLHAMAKCGNPFVAYHCQPEYLIYGDKIEIAPLQKIGKKNSSTYKDRFYQDRDVLLRQVRQCKSHESLMGGFLGYLSVYEHDLHYLESLYLGGINSSENLHERIHQLIPYLPVLEQMFVKKNGKIFYLIDVLEKSKHVDDEFLLNNELYPNICRKEAQLFSLVDDRFRELKKMVRAQKQRQPPAEKHEILPVEAMLTEVLTIIKVMAKPEEIYHYHTKFRGHQSVYYLLLVGESIGTELLERIQQSVKDRTEGKCDLVFLGHCRSWIQKNVYLSQGFFQKIMKDDYRVYSSTSRHPMIHWEEPYTIYYPDLDLYYKAAKKSVEQFKTLKRMQTEDNYECFYTLFTLAFTRILRVYLFRSLAYLPSYVAPEILWNLCLYAKPELEKLEYLFGKVSKERFFLNLTHYLKFTDHVTYGSSEQLEVMEEILVQLQTEIEMLIGREEVQ